MQITDDDIKRVERIFLPNGQSFAVPNNERINFIKCIDKSIHLQACPGSGKTTALLAKIYLLSEKMPFENNKGICVLTHTNVAINIIKNKLGNKADRLFTHPNFFGTIQSFVDRFLAIPAYIKIYGYKLKYIDNDFFKNRVLSKKNVYNNNNWLKNNKGDYDTPTDFVADIDVDFNSLEENDFKLNFGIRNEKSDTYLAIKDHFNKIFKNGYLRYKDAYCLAKTYLGTFPVLKSNFSSRFKYVFIDEAQDTSSIQKEIIEKCFNDGIIIQWIGDSNQGIMNNNEEESSWNPDDGKYKLIKLTDSKRVSLPIANIIKNVAVNKYDNLCGQDNIDLKPVIILFDENTKGKVLEKFAELVVSKKSTFNNEEKTLYEISQITGNPIKAVGWVGKTKENGLSIQSYFPNYCKKSSTKKRAYFPNFYTMLHLSRNESLKTFTERFYNCIIEALYLSDIKDSNDKRFTKISFTNHIESNNNELFIKLNKIIYKTFEKIINHNLNDNKFEEVSNDLITYIRNDLIFQINKESTNYLTEKEIKEYTKQQIINENYYSTNINGQAIKIQIDTVHAVKGETHTATLYLDTKYFCNSVKYFINELLGNSSTNNSTRKNYGLKIAHVALSRPTHLLCIAIEKNEVSNISFKTRPFEIIDLTENTSNA